MSTKRKLFEEFFVPAKSMRPQKGDSSVATDDKRSINESSSVSKKLTLVVLPGASGSLSKNMTSLMIPKLSKYFNVVVRTGKWQGWNPNSDENIRSVLDLCPPKGDHNDSSEYVILGNSFGNRVLCSLFVNEHFASSGVPAPRSVILCGYPMYGEKYTNERVSLFQSMPSGVRMCCISGSNDEFLHRSPPASSSSTKGTKVIKDSSISGIMKGETLYQFIIKSMNVNPEPSLHIIAGGGHGVIDVAKSKQDAAVSEVVNIIKKFVS